MEQMSTYTQQFECYSFDCDVKRRMQPGAILRYAQQVAGKQCNLLGMTPAFYESTDTAFLLAKQTLEIVKPIEMGQQFTIHTTPAGMSRAVYRRYTELVDENGALCAAVDSSWLLVDTITRRILRRQPECYDFVQWATEIQAEPLDMEIRKAEEPVDLGFIKAGYTLCDENGHINNTRYVDLFMDAMPPQALASQRVKKVTVVYHKEVPLNTSFRMQRGDLGPGVWYFTGEDGGRCCIEANLFLTAE